MKIIQILAGIVFVILLAAYCAQRSEQKAETGIEVDARAAIEARNLKFEGSEVIDGVRERAVCGRASGQRFVYRDKTKHAGRMGGLVLEGDLSPEVFGPFVDAWCSR